MAAFPKLQVLDSLNSRSDGPSKKDLLMNYDFIVAVWSGVDTPGARRFVVVFVCLHVKQTKCNCMTEDLKGEIFS